MEVVAQQASPATNWVPAQYTQPEIHDYRCAKTSKKGYKERNKRKLDEMEALHQKDQEEAAAREPEDDNAVEVEEQPSSKRQKAEGGLGYIPVSGRVWKAPGTRASQVKQPLIGSSWEKKMAQQAVRAQFQEHKKAAIEAARSKRKAAAQQRKDAEERKKVNRQKSEVVQKINSATAKKMMKSKKQKKMLRTADTN